MVGLTGTTTDPQSVLKMSKKKNLIAALISAMAAFLVYLPSLRNGFVLYDDDQYILNNRFIRSLDPAFLRKAFTTVVAANWHPLTVISYAVDYRLWGLNPFCYHLENTVLHALNALLVALLASKLYGIASGADKDNGSSRAFAGLAAALLFALHPLHVESVAWVSERKDVLYAFFFLLSVLSYMRYADTGRGKGLYYLLSLALFALSLMCKPMAITLPLVLLILDFYPLGRFHDAFTNFRVVAEKLPFFALSAASAALTIWAQRTGAILPSLGMIPLGERAAGAVRGYAFYVYKTVLPVNLAPFYPRPAPADAFDHVFAVSALAVLSLTVLVFWSRRKAFIAAWLYYVVTLVPVIGILQAGDQAAADRYTYLPLLGFFILAGAFCANLFRTRKGAAMALLLAAAIPLAALTVRQEGVWKDSLSLWSREIEIYPKVPRAFNQRGVAYMELGGYAQAIDDLSNAIRLDSGIPRFYYNRANAYSAIGDYRSAIDDYSRAISLKPDYALAYFNRGTAYGRLTRYDEALADYDMVIVLEPTSIAYSNRGIIKMNLGRWDEAMKDFKTAVGLAPENAQAWWDMGVAASKLGDESGARLYYGEARRRGFGGGLHGGHGQDHVGHEGH